MPPRSCEQKKDEVATATNSDDQTEGASHSVLEVFGQRDEADVVELDYEGQDGAACEEIKEPFGGWQKRSFHSARVFLIPANAKLLKRVTVTATRVDNQSEAGKMGPDGAGCCVFDMSNWGEQVLLSAALPSSCGYASYSSVVALSTLRTNPSTTHLVLTQLPAARKQHVAVIGPSSAQLNVAIIDGSGKEITAIATSHEPEEHENCRSVLTEVDPSVIIDSACEVCYVCVRFGAIGCETLGTFDQEEANVQVLVSDTTECSCRASTVSSQTYTVPITFDFTSADSSRSISASSRARLVLSGFDTFQTSSWKVTALRPPCGQLLSLDDPKKPPEPMTLRLKGEHFVENRKITIRPSLPKPLELAEAWIPLNGIQVGSSDIRRYTARFDKHFKRGNYVGSDATPGVATEVELLLQLSPLMLHPDYIVSQIPYSLLQQLSPQALDVQVSSGDGFYSTPHSFLVYNPPTVTHTTPSVLPRSAGGDVVVTGSGFVNSGRVCVRLFAFKKNRFTNSNEEQRALATINRVKRAESTNDGFFPYFSRDVAGTFISTTSLKFRMPSYLTSYNVYYSVSFDGRSFTEASSVSNVLLFSINAVTPKGGPISGNTYATLHGTNIDACLSSRSGLSSLVRVTWKRGARDLEHVMVPGEVYPHEDAVYFYLPQSKFGLYSIAVSVELALVSSGTTAVDTVPRFGRDEVSFVMYKTPTIKSVAPLSALVSGLSTTEIIVQGFEEKAVSNMRLAPKLRFKRRGQMQVSDAQLVSESRFECIVPRFNVANAVATELPLSALSSVRPIQRPRAGGAWSPRRVTSRPKLWTRAAGIFVALLGARNLRASKKNACNPFAVIYVGKMQLKSTRKDGVFSPVWNELFDFEWKCDSEFNLPSVRVVFENQLTADQSESLGHVELQFPAKDKQTQPFVLRAWLPLRRIRGKLYRKENEETAVHSQKNLKKQPQAPASSLGEVELAIAFVPPVAQTKKHKKALRSSIISVLTTQPQSRKQSQGKGGSSLYSAKKEKLLRAFRQRGAPVSLVPTELAVELALNGQDFWSVAPSTCYSVLTPIVVEVEPKFISIAGGSTLYLSGSNFVNTGCLRVAFAVLTKDDTTQTLRSDRTIVVEAKYRSSTSLVCTTPPLLNVATEASYLNVYVSLNGSDFDSIALPKQLVKLSEPASERPLTSVNVDERIEENDDTVTKEPLRKSPRKAPESDSAIALVNEQYVVDCKKVTALALDGCGSGRRSPTRGKPTGSPLPLHVYREIPTVHLVSPMDGPVYGGFAIVVEGRGFIDTGKIAVRFQLYTDQQDSTPRTEDESLRALQGQGSPPKSSNILEKPQGNKATAKEKTSMELVPSYVDVVAKFVSTERVLCPAPAFPQEGVYTVLVALNSVEFSRVSDGSWFLAWQNWQKRKRLLSHTLFSRASAAGEVASAAAASAPLDEDDIDKLRRKSNFMLPKIRSTLAASSEDSSSSFQAKTIESTSNNNFESDDTEETLMKDPRLLRWRPTSWMEAKVSGRTLLSLLEYLCGARETQQFICRRLRAAFRLQSAQSRGGTDSTETPALRFHLFVEALRMVFPDALMRELEELWQATEHRPDGTITIKQLLRRLLRNAPSDQRSKSPEPGPTHYDPRYSIVSSREAAAIILPPVAQPEYISDPTSTLFMDYDAAVQAVKPRAPRPVFRKRRFNTSWCNPVVEGAKEPTPSPRPPSITNRTRPRPHTRVSEDLASEATTGTTAAADDTTEAGDKKTSEQEKDNQVVTSKEDAVRTPQSPAQATAASSSKHARNSTPSSSPPPPVNTNTIMPRQANLSGPNPFYNDIAPLYAKFLNSTEVKRFLKQ
ncbi:hypothetical protein PInf_023568 [Phytophthora infestans]|nr:hypothetical protein PInf_023568 [Phytophthora infestans]